MATSFVTVFAGTTAPIAGFLDGVGTNSMFAEPHGIAWCESRSFLLVSDSSNHIIRKINVSSRAVTTIFGDFSGTVPPGADGIGTSASFPNVVGIAIDAACTFAVAVSYTPLPLPLLHEAIVLSSLALARAG